MIIGVMILNDPASISGLDIPIQVGLTVRNRVSWMDTCATNSGGKEETRGISAQKTVTFSYSLTE